MKNCFALLCLVLLIGYMPADAQSTNQFPPTGNVGIGTLSPTTRLDIANSQNNGIQMTFDATQNYRAWIRPFWNSYTDTRIDFAISGVSGVAPATIMSVGYNSNVGIGTTAPGNKLQIESATMNDGVQIYNNVNETSASAALFMSLKNNSGSIRTASIEGDGTGKLHLRTGATALNTYGPVRQTIDASGNIGFGTSSPATKLDIANAQNSGIQMTFDGTQNYRAWVRPFWNSDSDTRIDFAISRTTGVTPETIMSVGYDHNVGIGTVTPTQKLSVNGNISAKKLIITQLGWSDYVFDKDYKLRNLSSLEKFIADNHHLPDIPSAKEVEEKGISVGDNQALLLRKIEELTLYIIELDKHNLQQGMINAELRTEIEKIKTRKKADQLKK